MTLRKQQRHKKLKPKPLPHSFMQLWPTSRPAVHSTKFPYILLQKGLTTKTSMYHKNNGIVHVGIYIYILIDPGVVSSRLYRDLSPSSSDLL